MATFSEDEQIQRIGCLSLMALLRSPLSEIARTWHHGSLSKMKEIVSQVLALPIPPDGRLAKILELRGQA